MPPLVTRPGGEDFPLLLGVQSRDGQLNGLLETASLLLHEPQKKFCLLSISLSLVRLVGRVRVQPVETAGARLSPNPEE